MGDGVWITGIGTANPLGTSYAETADGLLAGRPAVRTIERFDVSRQHSKVAGLVASIPLPVGQDAVEFPRRDRMEQLALWCGTEALRDAGLWGRQDEATTGLILGIGGEWLRLWEADWQAGGRRVQMPEDDEPSTVHILKRDLGLTGPTLTTAAACASGNYALAEGRQWIRRGWVDRCLAGAVDLTISRMGLSAFGNLRALSTKRNASPGQASRPFDRDRDGFVMAEGGAIFVLERESAARRRGARAYAEIVGFGASSDAFHLVIPSSNSEPMANAMRLALRGAGMNTSDVDYVNAHATSTPLGDVGEARAIRLALGDSAPSVPVSSTKGMTGHLICAAAALETIAVITAFEHGAIPPTINLDDLDPECAGLNHVANAAQVRPVRAALNNSFGFGGSNTCLALRKV